MVFVVFNATEYAVVEDDGSVGICVQLIGNLERDVAVTFTTTDFPANTAQGKSHDRMN